LARLHRRFGGGGEGDNNNKVHLGEGERRPTIEEEGEKSSDGRSL